MPGPHKGKDNNKTERMECRPMGDTMGLASHKLAICDNSGAHSKVLEFGIQTGSSTLELSSTSFKIQLNTLIINPNYILYTYVHTPRVKLPQTQQSQVKSKAAQILTHCRRAPYQTFPRLTKSNILKLLRIVFI